MFNRFLYLLNLLNKTLKNTGNGKNAGKVREICQSENMGTMKMVTNGVVYQSAHLARTRLRAYSYLAKANTIAIFSLASLSLNSHMETNGSHLLAISLSGSLSLSVKEP